MRSLSLCVAFLLGCSSTTTGPGPVPSDVPITDVPPAVDTPRPGRVPLRHRPIAAACPDTRPAGMCIGGVGAPATCMADRDCTMGVNGRCVGNPHNGCGCSYDACARDSDCADVRMCECRTATGPGSGANVCLGGNCRIDGDCGPAGYCSPTYGSCGNYGGIIGYQCHTPADECIDDADCAGTDAGFAGQAPYCAFNPETGRWRCSNAGCVG